MTQTIASSSPNVAPNNPASPLRPASRRLKVCHLSMTLRTGGLERLLVDFAKFHDPQRFELAFVALGELGPPADDLRQAGFSVQSLEIAAQGKFQAVRELRQILRTGRFDILHTHNTYPQFYGALAARWAGTPTVINTQHGRGCGSGLKSLWQFRLANRFTDRIVGVSQDATELCRRQDRRSAGKMACIWNGIDVDRFTYQEPRHAPTAITVGRLSPEKDLGTLLHALPYVVSEYPDFRLRIVGDGVERRRLEYLTDSLGLRSFVEFLGERKDIPELLQTAGFYVSSSKTEGISLTLLEAMAVGLPIVTTAVGGNPEILVPEVTGHLVPPLNPDALAVAIRKMIEERPLWPDMGRAARERVETQFNIRTMVSTYEQLYLECHLTASASSSACSTSGI